jgi:hypothetical protein
MHADVGIAKLGDGGTRLATELAGYGHNDVSGSGAVHQLTQAIDGAEHRNGFGLGMEG